MNDVGSVKAALKDLFESQVFRNSLQTIAAEFHDGISLDEPGTVLTYELIAEGIPAFPVVEIIARDAASDEDSDVLDLDHQIDVIWTVIGDDEDVVTKQLERYALATMRPVFLANLSTTGNFPARVSGVAWSQMDTRKSLPRPFIKGAMVALRIRTVG